MASIVSQDPPRGHFILFQLEDQCVPVFKFPDVAEVGDKGQLDFPAVQIGRPFREQVGLHMTLAGVGLKGWSGPDVDHGLPLGRLWRFRCNIVRKGTLHHPGPGRIDAFRWEQLAGFTGREVGGAESKRASTAIPFHDFATPGVVPPEQIPGAIEVAFVHLLADLRAGDRQLAFDVGGDVHHVETIGLAARPQQLHIAFAPGSEPVVVADDDRGRSEPVYEDFPDEFGGLQPGEGPIEMLDDEVVESRLRQAFRPLPEGLQQLQSAVLPEEHLPGVRVEGQHDRLGILPPGFFGHPIEQGPVAEVDPVKCAGGDDAVAVRLEMGKTLVDAHCGKVRMGGLVRLIRGERGGESGVVENPFGPLARKGCQDVGSLG